MTTRLTDVVRWLDRTTPGDRVIPDHLKLAILTRGRVRLPARNVTWLLDVARALGETWPDRLRRDLAEIVPEVPVTVELFSNQRPSMTRPEITESLHGYLTLRQRRHLPECFLLFHWFTHDRRRDLEATLDLDMTLLFTKARARPQPRNPERYLLVVYACLPRKRLAAHVAPVVPAAPPAPTSAMPPLEGITSPSTAKNVRDGPGESSTVIGTQVGTVVPVRVLDKREADGHVWFEIEPVRDLPVDKSGAPGVVAAGTRCWIVGEEEVQPSLTQRLVLNKGPSKVGGGLEWVAAPWDFFRHQLREFEASSSGLGLEDRITRLRQMSHDEDVPFDTVIGARKGTTYLDSLPFVAGRWQMLKDYQTVRTPDGRIIDLHHILVGLDVLRRPEIRSVMFLGIDVGSNWAAATWAGDLGAGATDMALRASKEWESRHKGADVRTRTQYYFDTRAGDRDLMADVDAWGILPLRSPRRDSIDALLASYYEHTLVEGHRTVTTARRDAVGRFLSHYGFTYDVATDYFRYPHLVTQSQAVRRVRSEIARFAYVWEFRSRPLNRDKPDLSHVPTMTLLFLYWLEYQAIENGVATP